MTSRLEDDVAKLTEQLRRHSASRRTHLYQQRWWNDRLIDWSMSHPSFKTQLFRFVDVFPATSDDGDVLRHLEEYFDRVDLPKIVDLGLGLVEQVPLGDKISTAVARRSISRMAQQFIVGRDAVDAVQKLGTLWNAGTASTVDVLGEKTVTADEAARYATRVDDLLSELLRASCAWNANALLDYDDLSAIARVNVSVKPTALSPRFAPLTADEGIAEIKERLRPILRKARDGGALVHVDMEHYEVKDLTIELFTTLLDEEEFADLQAGITVQAYLQDSEADLRRFIELSSAQKTPLTIRLVKGAYWDTETIHAAAQGWPPPVYTHKADSDANFERCTRLLHDHHGKVRAAFGSHNLSSLAFAIAYARRIGIPDNGYEMQMLYGMGEQFHDAVRNLGIRLRVYAPVGEIVPGMAYLVRRLLENTANEGLVATRSPAGPLHARELPHPTPATTHEEVLGAESTGLEALSPSSFRPEPPLRWFDRETREMFAATLARVAASELGDFVPAVVDDRPMSTDAVIRSVDPAEPSRIVATSSDCGIAEAETALASARRALGAWQRTPAQERAGVLVRAAAWMRDRRFELAALEVYEAGKPWSEADGDVCEAIDYCEYYAREMMRLAKGAPVQSPPGEVNSMRYIPRGIGVVIAPWNFPLAIPTGMVTAALVAGNAVLFKPAEQTPLIASKLREALHASGLPGGVLAFLPGRGEVIGDFLVRHPDISFIAFTGSKAVGLGIIQAAAAPRAGQSQVKKIVAEMGGKNALIIDSDADLDQAVPITIGSAFGYSGQKCSACSRVIVVGDIYEPFLERLVGAARELRIGHPENPAVQMGPLIDEDAYERVRRYIASAPGSGEIVLAREDLPDNGWFIGPTVVSNVLPGSPLASDEIFGPVLSVMSARSVEDAIAIANSSSYALTAGIVSRSPAHIRLATDELHAGNIYVNRNITGAVVGRQPFGGFGLSGTGTKAGGPDYLLHYLEPQVVSENTIRQGSAPTED